MGLAQGADGLYYVLRASEVTLEQPAWDGELARHIRNLMAFRRREEAEQALLDRLRRAASIVAEESVLDRLRGPGWEDWAGPGS